MKENNDIILSLSNIRKGFYGTEVLHGLNFEVKRGEVHGLVGENGAGKSTLMNVLGGIYIRDDGEMRINGELYDPQNPKDAQKAGIGFVHQELNLFPNLTVAENMFLENLPLTGSHMVDYKKMRKEAEGYLKKFGVAAKASAKVEELPMGVRQTVEIAKVLSGNAKIVIFDEPTTSLSQKEKDNLFKIIEDLKKEGITIIYISHILEDVFELCDTISVLRDGNLIDTQPTSDLTEHDIITMMVGRELTNVYPTIEKEIGEVVFKAEHVVQGRMVRDVSIELRKGEIVGLFGLMGAGRTEFVRTLFGVDKMDSGKVIFKGKEMKNLSPKKCIRSGMAFVTEDRRDEGLIMPKPIKENLSLVNLYRMRNGIGVVNRKKENSEADRAIKEFRIKVMDKDEQLARNLSGGNQQKVVIGKWMMGNPEMLIMDEPTRGVDVGAKYEIYSIMLEMAKQGSCVLMVSSEMEELMGVCDKILIMSKGKIIAELKKGEYNQETIMNYALKGGI